MSWLFSRALGEEFSRAKCSGGAACAPSSVMPTAHKFWFRDRTMEPSQLSRFGPTCEVLTASHGEALLTWYREDFLARTSASQARAPASMEAAADYGATWRASWARYDPATCSWRTAQCCLFGEWEESSPTWPRWGMTRGGECWELPTWAPPTFGSGCGSWPTPTAESYGSCQGGAMGREGQRNRPSLQTMAATGMWPTPTTGDAKSSGSRNTSQSKAHPGISLTDAVRGDQGKGRMIPTPAARDYRHPNAKPYAERGGGTKGEQLPNFVGGALNPTWVEWLMGWPIGWTDLEPLATGKYRNAPCSPGECSRDPPEQGASVMRHDGL